MGSLSRKIQFAFILSISIVAVCAFILLLVNQLSSFQSEQIITTMTMEYNIATQTDELVKTYNSVVKNPGNPKFITDYQTIHQNLLQNISTLKTRVISQESKLLLLGVEGTVKQVVQECDTGLKEVQENNFLNFSTHFVQANKENDFVHENIKELLQKELEYLSENQKTSQQVYIVTLMFSFGIFTVVVIITILFSRSFSKQLTNPLQELSLFASDIANGNLQNKNKRVLTITNDEIGSLTKSIYTMVDKLIQMIDKEQAASKETQRMNSLMVGREIKMVELKKELEELKKKQVG